MSDQDQLKEQNNEKEAQGANAQGANAPGANAPEVVKKALSFKDRLLEKKVPNIAMRTVKIYSEKEVAVYVGNATLLILTAVFPLLMLVLSVVNMLPGFTPEDFCKMLLEMMPNLSSMESIITSVLSNLNQQSSGLLASVTAITTLVAASGGITAIQQALQKITPGSEKKPYDKAFAVLYTLIFILLVIPMLLMQVLGSTIRSAALSILSNLDLLNYSQTASLLVVAGTLVAVALVFLMLLCVYKFFPGGHRTLKSQLPGAVLCVVIWFLLSKLFSVYITNFWNKSAIYGSLAGVFIMILYLNYMIMALLMGAALNAAMYEYHHDTEDSDEETE